MTLQIEYYDIDANGRRKSNGSWRLPVNNTVTAAAQQPVTPAVYGVLEVAIRSDAPAQVSISATPDPTNLSAVTTYYVDGKTPLNVRVASGLKIAAIAVAASEGNAGLDKIRNDIVKRFGIANITIEDHPGISLAGVYYPIIVCYADGYAMGAIAMNGEFVPFQPEVAGDSELIPLVSYNGKNYVSVLTGQNDGANASWVLGGVTDDGRIVVEYPIDSPGSDMPGTFPDVAHIVLLGQSNNQGAESQPVVSPNDVGYGAYKFARGVVTRLDFNNPGTPLLRPATDFFFVPLTAAVQEVFTGETIAVGMTSKLKGASYGGRFSAVDTSKTKPHFLCSYPNRGGKWLAQLDQRDYETNANCPPMYAGVGSYFAHFIDDIYRAKQQATAEGRSYGVVALSFCQGENEGTGVRLPTNPFVYEPFSTFVANYKNDLKTAYENWNSVARQVTGQGRDIPMFITQVCTQWAGESQLQLSEEDIRVFLATPFYFTPSGLNSIYNGSDRGSFVHHTADGQRWVGEIVGKVMRKVLVEGKNWRGLVPVSINRITDRTVKIKYNVPVKPLVFENSFLPKAVNQGFQVFLGTPEATQAEYTITSVAITADDEVTITLASDLPAGFNAYICYGMQRFTDIGSTAFAPTGTQAAANLAVGNGSIPTTEVVFNADISVRLTPMFQEGCFYLRQYKSDGSLQAEAVARSFRVASGKTYIRFENRSLTGSFNTTALVSIERDRPFGNLRDSDDELSVFDFAATHYGNRAGKPYPLWNWSAIFQKMIVTT